MDLIDRAAAIEEVDDTVTSVSVCATVEQARSATWAKGRIRERLEKMPIIEAVPLEPLCKMLSESLNYPPCEDNLDECHKCELTQKYGVQRECWEKYLRKWMEGLDGIT